MSKSSKVLTRTKHGIISGTLGGLAEHFGFRKTRLRLLFVILALFGIGFIMYFVLWVSIPSYSQRSAF